MNLCYIGLTNPNLDDDSLNKVLNLTPPNSIILLEGRKNKNINKPKKLIYIN